MRKFERPVPVHRPVVEPRRARRRTGPLASGAAVVLVAAGALFVGVSLGGKLGAAQPSPGASLAIAPTLSAPSLTTPAPSDSGKGKGNGNGKGPKN